MNLFTRLQMACGLGRTITGKLLNGPAFQKEIWRAVFLLENLYDEDLNWAQPNCYLRKVKGFLQSEKTNSLIELEAVSSLYLTWVAIAIQIQELDNYEVDAWWLYRLNAAVDHIIQRVITYLPISEQELLIQHIPSMHQYVNNADGLRSFQIRDN